MDEFELTRRVLGEAEDDPAALERVREHLREAIAEERRRNRPPRWRRVLPVAAAFGVLVVAVAALVVKPGREAAASELRRLGGIASGQERISPGTGDFLLIRSEELRPESYEDLETGVSFGYVTRLSLATWLTPEGSGIRLEEERFSRFASEADRAAWLQLGSPVLNVSRTERFRPGEGPLLDVSGLPADPDRLIAVLRSGGVVERPRGDDQVFILIGELLAQGDAPPQVRAGLFEVAARLEGVELVGEILDPLDRPGIGISIPTPTGQSQLIFDPDSAQLLAIERYETRPGGAEQLDSWIAALPTTVVDEAPPEPEG